MSANKKSSGFFIIEILIVLVIVGILVIAMLPNFSTYTQRAKFVDVLTAADAVRPSVDACILQLGTPGAAIPAGCTAGTNGIPASPVGSSGNFQSYVVTAGQINASSIPAFGTVGTGSYTYIITPTYQTSGAVTWSDTSTPGSCKTAGLC